MAQTQCDGTTALGSCDKRALYLIRRGSRQHVAAASACGLHLAQLVKRMLRGTNGVEVFDA